MAPESRPSHEEEDRKLGEKQEEILQTGHVIYNKDRKRLISHSDTKIYTAVRKKFSCLLCGIKVSSKGSLKRHHDSTHAENKKTLNCGLCGKILTNKSNLKRHMQTVHDPEKRPVLIKPRFPSHKVWLDSTTSKGLIKLHDVEGREADAKIRDAGDGEIDSESLFSCGICQKDLSSEESLKRHRDTIHAEDKKAIRCHSCGKTFSDKTNLNRHITTVHSESRPHGCEKCGKRFVSLQKLERHLGLVTQKIYNCNLCGIYSSNKGNLKKHLGRVHKLAESSLQNEHHCTWDEFINRNSTIITFKSSSSVDTTPVECDICEMIFADKVKLIKHMKNHENTATVRFKCSVCARELVDFSHFLRHMKKNHNSEEKPRTCHHCNIVFRNKQLATEHRESLHKTVSCNLCGKILARHHLERHKETLHAPKGLKFPCNFCGRIFGNQLYLKRHQTVKNSDKGCKGINKKNRRKNIPKTLNSERTEYKCWLCPSVFSSVSDFKLHMNEHSSEKFTCDICSKVFTTKMGVSQHLQNQHFNAQTFTCVHCDKIYRSRSALHAHIQTHSTSYIQS